jgi:hypothetical protein
VRDCYRRSGVNGEPAGTDSPLVYAHFGHKFDHVKDLLKVAGVGTLAVLAMVFIFGARASANDSASCAPSTGFVPQFCVNVPVGTSARRETTVPLSTVHTARADVRVESGIPAPEVVRLAASVDSAIAHIEQVFDRPFTTKPRILVFATRASFARGTQDLFGYSPETAANVAASYGGVFDPQTLTIAVCWESTASSSLASLLAHELTHLATRQIVGSAAVPAWFEEGLAAKIQGDDAAIGSDAQLAARSLLANAPRALDTIATLADWHRSYARLGIALYAVSAEAVTAMETRLGRPAMLALLTEVGAGARFEDAYRAHAGETLEAFMSRFTGEGTFAATVAVGTAPDGGGNIRWTLGGFSPNSDVRITISGKSYDLAFTVRTDGIGMYRGTFGSTSAAGSYTLTAETTSFHATATIDTASR